MMPERPIPYRSPPDCIFLLFMVINSGKVNKNTKYMGAYSSKLFQLYLLSIKGGYWAFFLNHKLPDNQFQTFQSEKCCILPQWESWGLPPEAEAFFKSQVARQSI